ncbi:MAG: phosphate transport system regulatory protein PhoU [Desulfuromonas sp.]|nr:MAG: phosphate transport system regulatory protein PhoU [Desulfuromonas sp.]
MTGHMEREISRLKKSILALAAVVEESVKQAVIALEKRDTELAKKIIQGDLAVNQQEVELEEECLKILALHQPVAADLRFIVAVLKINNDLERIGDLAANMADRTVDLVEDRADTAPFDLEKMADKVELMLEKALDALVNYDIKLANEAIELDDEVDQMHKQSFAEVKKQIRQNPEQMDAQINYLSISRYLERIADLATNIAEDVVYMIEGKIVRHIL